VTILYIAPFNQVFLEHNQSEVKGNNMVDFEENQTI
jgi:hypothetical protein